MLLSHFHHLSEGEKHRINIARYLAKEEEYIVIDEFTSYLDRDCAKKVAKGISDYIYKHNKKNIVFLFVVNMMLYHLNLVFIHHGFLMLQIRN